MEYYRTFLLRGVYVRSDGLVSHLVYFDHTTKLLIELSVPNLARLEISCSKSRTRRCS